MGGVLRGEAPAVASRNLGASRDVVCTGECQAIQDVADGWDGFCLGLELLNQSTSPAACRSACCADPDCEVWQWGNSRTDYGRALGSCYTGRGLECSSNRFDDFLVLAGQRISHGTVAETIKLEMGVWCTGRGMQQARSVRPLSTTGTYKSSVDQCQKVCFEAPACSIWEHSTTKGCWYGYSDKCSAGAEGAETMVAGERVARACGAGVHATPPTDYLVVFGIIGAVALLLTLCAALMLLCSGMFRSRPGQLEVEEGECTNALRVSRDSSRSKFTDDSGCSRFSCSRGNSLDSSDTAEQGSRLL